jgi:hypothetical protein
MEQRARDLLGSHLGIRVIEQPVETYRSNEGGALDGEWLGGFVQPGVILSAASAVRLTLADGQGSSLDEYGPATLTVTRRVGDRVEITKTYGGPFAAPLRYVGRLSGGVLAGYWYSAVRPGFCGLFWLSRRERLSDASRLALERHVRAWSWRRPIALFVFYGLVVVALVGLHYDARVSLACGAALAAMTFIHRTRARALVEQVMQ